MPTSEDNKARINFILQEALDIFKMHFAEVPQLERQSSNKITFFHKYNGIIILKINIEMKMRM